MPGRYSTYLSFLWSERNNIGHDTNTSYSLYLGLIRRGHILHNKHALPAFFSLTTIFKGTIALEWFGLTVTLLGKEDREGLIEFQTSPLYF